MTVRPNVVNDNEWKTLSAKICSGKFRYLHENAIMRGILLQIESNQIKQTVNNELTKMAFLLHLLSFSLIILSPIRFARRNKSVHNMCAVQRMSCACQQLGTNKFDTFLLWTDDDWNRKKNSTSMVFIVIWNALGWLSQMTYAYTSTLTVTMTHGYQNTSNPLSFSPFNHCTRLYFEYNLIPRPTAIILLFLLINWIFGIH